MIIKRLMLFGLVLGLIVACGGEFEDEYYDDEGYVEEYPDEEGYEDEGDYEDGDYEEDDYVEPSPDEEVESDETTESAGTSDLEEAAENVDTDRFESTDCKIDVPASYNVECGYLTVPENRQVANSRMIELEVAILPAAQGGTPDPIIFLDGGPGGSALSSLESEPDVWADYGFAQNRHLIFIDQRGTGYSWPSLNCPEMDDDFEGLDNELECRDRLLDEGVDLTAYNTAENAADIADLADALGLESYNLLGVSYGTRLALAVMRDHPENIRSVVLDSPFPPNADPARDEASITYQRILAVIRACEQDAECNSEFPNLEDILIETVEQMNSDPPSDEIDGDFLLQVLYQALFSADQYASAVPLLIYLSYEGDYSFLEDAGNELFGGYARPYQSDNDGDSEGMYTSVMCRDEFSFTSPAAAEDRTADEVPTELASALSGASLEQFELCDVWGAGEASDRENAAVVSDIPTLILAGELDPATPPEWGTLTAETLSNGQLFIIPNGGHSLLSSNDCAIGLTNAFIDNPTAAVDGSCVNQIPSIEFEY